MELEICLRIFVRFLRMVSFTMYLDALTELAPWFYALDHINYARCIPIHLKDMAELPKRHPVVAKEFNLMVVNLLFIRPDGYSQASLLIRHMNRTTPLSKEVEELLALLITLVLCCAG